MRPYQYFSIFFLIILQCSLSEILLGQQILVDEDFTDWQPEMLVNTDATGDGAFNGVDFGRVWMHHDTGFLFIRIETGKTINLQSDNLISLAIDMDMNIQTGNIIDGIGADLVYHFGLREGFLYLSGQGLRIGHQDIGLVTLPTVTSDVFEIAIRRSFPHAGDQVDLEGEIRFIIRDNRLHGDKIPDAASGLSYTFDETMQGSLPSVSIQRTNPEGLRVLSYNVLFDGLFEPGRQPSFLRLLRASDPDIIAFQEIYDRSAFQTAQVVEQALPRSEGQQWYFAKAEPDIIIVSKYPVMESLEIDGTGIFKIDIGETDIVMVVTHFACCANDAKRQDEVDALMAFIRTSTTQPSIFQIPAGTPMIIAGDMNFVGDSRQRKTLLEGDIYDENNYGSDFAPDWDGSALEDARPYTTGFPYSVTWYQPQSSFSPGRLDYIVYTGSVLTLENTFVLKTDGLGATELALYNLSAEDSNIASDHLPCIADFSLVTTASYTQTIDAQNVTTSYPNPVTDGFLYIKTAGALPRDSEVFVCDARGIIQEIVRVESVADSLRVDVSSLNPGIYYYVIDSGGSRYSASFLIYP